MRVMYSIASCSLIKRTCRIIHEKCYIISICILFLQIKMSASAVVFPLCVFITAEVSLYIFFVVT